MASGLLTANGVAPAAGQGFEPNAVYRVGLGDSPSEGPSAAPVTIVEFSDFACGYCGRVQATLAQLKVLYPGLLRIVHRTLPLDTDNTLAAEAALAAHAQGQYQAMHDRLFAMRGAVDRIDVELLAQSIGLDMVRFRADMDTARFRAAVKADEADANALGVRGTPMFFVNGKPLSGAVGVAAFVDLIEPELIARAKLPPRAYVDIVAAGRPFADQPTDQNVERNLDLSATYRVGLGLPGHSRGPADANVTLVVWSDFECPFCTKVAPTIAQLAKANPSLRVVFRHLPMANHANAQLAAEAAVEAAAQGKFWPFHDALFAQLEARNGLTTSLLLQAAAAAQCDLTKMNEALRDHRHRAAVRAEVASGFALAVDGTPTMFMNGRPIIGAKSLAVLQTAYDEVSKELAGGKLPNGEVYPVLMAGAAGEERADPQTIPSLLGPGGLRDLQPLWATLAACRRGDATGAMQLFPTLTPAAKVGAATVCNVFAPAMLGAK